MKRPNLTGLSARSNLTSPPIQQDILSAYANAQVLRVYRDSGTRVNAKLGDKDIAITVGRQTETTEIGCAHKVSGHAGITSAIKVDAHSNVATCPSCLDCPEPVAVGVEFGGIDIIVPTCRQGNATESGCDSKTPGHQHLCQPGVQHRRRLLRWQRLRQTALDLLGLPHHRRYRRRFDLPAALTRRTEVIR